MYPYTLCRLFVHTGDAVSLPQWFGTLSNLIYFRFGTDGGGGNRLWSLVFVVMSLDVASTVAGLSLGLVELNPIAVVGLNAVGVAALAVLKAPALAIGLVGWRTLSDPYRQLNLFGLAMPWLAAALTNCSLILATI